MNNEQKAPGQEVTAGSGLSDWLGRVDRRMNMEWQSIETAPKDGTSFWGYWPGGKHDCSMYAFKWHKEGWWETNEDYPTTAPTHWMPLPDPPAA